MAHSLSCTLCIFHAVILVARSTVPVIVCGRIGFYFATKMTSILIIALARLSQEIAKAKGATASTVQEVQKPEPAPVEEKPKKKRGRKPKAEKAA